jgi:predicted transcriptional regulator
MKFSTKIQKLADAEKYETEKRAEISAELLAIIQQHNIDITKLLKSLNLSRNSYYHYAEKKFFPTDWLKKISQSDVFKQLDI